MNCQNCKHHISGDCVIVGKPVMEDFLCNAWELSFEGFAELQARITKLEEAINDTKEEQNELSKL